jgi:hypothetical protein
MTIERVDQLNSLGRKVEAIDLDNTGKDRVVLLLEVGDELRNLDGQQEKAEHVQVWNI